MYGLMEYIMFFYCELIQLNYSNFSISWILFVHGIEKDAERKVRKIECAEREGLGMGLWISAPHAMLPPFYNFIMKI